MPMTITELADALSLRQVPTLWLRHAAALERTDLPSARQLLRPEVIEAWREALSPPAAVHQALVDHLSLFEQHPAMDRLLGFGYHLLYELGETDRFHLWPLFDESFLPGGNMFYVYLLLLGRPALHRRHGAMGIAPHVSDDTLADLFNWVTDHHQSTGHWGLSNLRFVASSALQDSLFKLGRLQFNFNTFKVPFRGYRHKTQPRCIVVAREGERYRSDGQFDGTNRRLDSTGGWTTTLEDEGESLRCHPVHPDGHVQTKAFRLRSADWQPVFDLGSPALAVHIPAGPAVTPVAVQDAFTQAIEFFPRVFPDRPFEVMWCHSWLLDGQLQQWLAPQSNIVTFQKAFYLLPYPNTNGDQTIERVFGSVRANLAKVAADTSLAKHILDHCRRGGAWRCQAGVLFPDLCRQNLKPYRQPDAELGW